MIWSKFIKSEDKFLENKACCFAIITEFISSLLDIFNEKGYSFPKSYP